MLQLVVNKSSPMSYKQTAANKAVYKELEHVLKTSNRDVATTVVNAPFLYKLLVTSLDLGIVVLLRVNETDGTVDRVALSDTELAKGAIKVSAKPFHSIKIPINAKKNIIVDAIRSGEYRMTDDWEYLFAPVLTREQARLNQVSASIECSIVQPLVSGKGALIFSFYQPPESITDQHLDFTKRYAHLVDGVL